MRAASNDLLFGTLDTYLVWHWTGGRTHQTDLTMASRTLMADPATGRWADDVIEGMGIPLELLPEIVSTRGQSVELDGGMVLAASIADQSASALAVMGEEANALLVNLGTGGFVLRATGRDFEARTGYLAGPLLSDEGKGTSYVSEGTINGAGSAIDVHGTPPTDLPDRDPARDAFCLPDMAGVGSPHWRPDLSQAFSGAAMDLSPQDKRRVVLEGILFRVREIMEGLGGCKMARRVVLSGGVSRDPAVAKGLAASLGRSVEVLDDAESTLLGAARLAAGLNPRSALGVKTVLPGASGRYLHEKYHRWKKWMTMVLVNS